LKGSARLAPPERRGAAFNSNRSISVEARVGDVRPIGRERGAGQAGLAALQRCGLISRQLPNANGSVASGRREPSRIDEFQTQQLSLVGVHDSRAPINDSFASLPLD
jgi:hypothetical protein